METATGNGAASSTGVIDKPIVVDNTTNGGGLEVYRGNKTIASPITLNGKLSVESYVRINGVWTTVLSGPITGSGNLEFHTNSNGTSRLGLFQITSDNPTFSGTTTIGGGGGFYGATSATDRITQVVIGNDGPTGSLGTGDIIMNPAGGTTSLSLVLAKIGTYTMPNNITMNGNDSIAKIRGFDAANITLSGVISGTGRVSVEDPATQMTFSGNNTYTGPTVLVAGRMVAASNQAFRGCWHPTTGYVQLRLMPAILRQWC